MYILYMHFKSLPSIDARIHHWPQRVQGVWHAMTYR